MPKKNSLNTQKIARPKVKKVIAKATPKKVKSAVKKTSVSKTNTIGKSSVNKSSKQSKVNTTLRGMKDILPKDNNFWKRIHISAWDVASAYGFDYMETPILEETSLFVRSIGKTTDVVDKEMYTFEDRDGGKISLRPEQTAGVARAYINHGLHNVTQPIKVWSIGPMFRYDRPQAGRYRQFHQFNCEVIGERDPEIDAELIVVAYNYLLDLGVRSQVLINSIGTLEDRERYVVELVGYLRSKRSYLSEESKKRINKNPLRVLDSKDDQDKAVIEEAPQIIDWLSDDSRKYFMKVLEYLDQLEIPYMLSPTLVRGLDYYTDTVFELVPEGGEDGQQSSLGGGGRYDGLVEHIGGRSTPGAGFGIGLERALISMRKKFEENPEEYQDKSRKFYFAQLGEQARRQALSIIESLRKDGIQVYHNLAKASLKTQLELANKYGATHSLILGQKEVQDGTVMIRDMDSGIQEIVDQKKLKNELVKLLQK